MTTLRRIMLVAAAWYLSSVMGGGTDAATVTWDFSATVTQQGQYSALVNVGDTITGTFSYDTNATLITTNQRTYYYSPSPATPQTYSLSLGGEIFKYSTPAPPAPPDGGGINITEGGGSFSAFTSFSGQFSANSYVHNSFYFYFQDVGGQALTSHALPTDLDLSKFSIRQFQLTDNGDIRLALLATVTSLTVPEPASLNMAGTAAAVGLGIWACRRKRHPA